MTFEEGPDSNFTTHNNHHLLDWLEESSSFIPAFDEIASYEWWTQDDNQAQLIQTPSSTTLPATPTTTTSSTPRLPLPQQETSKKRKLQGNTISYQKRKAGIDTSEKKANGKGSGGNSSNGGSKEARWAEQLLNACAAAIEAGNVSRVQHLFYVLEELASSSGDVNHRLASHGLRLLSLRVSSSSSLRCPTVETPISFATTDPKLFRSSLIKFHEVSPWFALPNALANAAISRTLTLTVDPRPLHVIDLGVSHGVQWPTLLESLTRRSPPPPLVRLTVAGAGAAPPGPFSAAPRGYDYAPHLLRYAKSIDLNLRIDRDIAVAVGETLVVCAQFRVGHAGADGRRAILQSIKELNPDLVVLSELEAGDGSSPAMRGFGMATEILWRFLESTNAAFKGKESEERRVMEGEAARILEAEVEERVRWKERMLGLRFREEGFGEEAVDAGRALLRKYDGNWEMRTAEKAVGLWWKGQPVSFCSLWKTDTTG
ncbi:protein NODULATION SIGNALING PATHWAY 1 [Typha latifolia]|uniref:protein NODULATION SIGNALING PATHWAY 1 n=1 Tax=Typha latifolia TaxID=4733 RepID=UPI003C30AB07